MADEQTVKIKIPRINPWMAATVVLAIILIAVLATGFSLTGKVALLGSNQLTPEEAAKKAVDWIKNYFKSGGSNVQVELINATDTGIGVYQFTVKITDSSGPKQETYYVSKDGEIFFPWGIPTKITQTQEQPQQSLSCKELPKADKPRLDAFVVSNCPFGLQMQRILTLVVALFKDDADIKIRYIGSVTSDGKNITSMHGDKEAEENLRQICIREEQSDKFWDYIACYIKKGDTDNCLTEAKIDKTKLNTCIGDPSRGVNYAKEDFALQNQYGISASPTIVFNGMVIDSTTERALANGMQINMRSAELWKNIVCCGFNTKPSECSQTLPTDPANYGFSETYSVESTKGGSGVC